MTCKRKKILAATLCVAALLIASGFGFYFGGNAVSHQTELLIPTGSTFAQLSDSIRSNKAFRNSRTLLRIARSQHLPQHIHPGRYVFKRGMSYADVIRRLKAGHQTPQRLTFNNIRTIDRLSAVIGRRLEVDSATLFHLLTDWTTTAR